MYILLLITYIILGIFTIDVDFSTTKIEEGIEAKVVNEDDENLINQKFEDHINREKRRNLKREIIEGISEGVLYYAWDEFVFQDEEFTAARKKFTEEFNEIFLKGYEAYINGQWQLAKKHLEQANVSYKTFYSIRWNLLLIRKVIIKCKARVEEYSSICKNSIMKHLKLGMDLDLHPAEVVINGINTHI